MAQLPWSFVDSCTSTKKRGAPLCTENNNVSSIDFGASNKTMNIRRTSISHRLFLHHQPKPPVPHWTSKSPKRLKNCNIFCSNEQFHRFNNLNFNFNSKCNHQLNRQHFTVKRQVLPWSLAASVLSQLKQRRLQADTAMVNAAMAVARWRTALDIGASSEASWRWLKCWSRIRFLDGFYSYDQLAVLAFFRYPVAVTCENRWGFPGWRLAIEPAWSEHHNPSTEFVVADGIVEVGKASKWWTWTPWRHQLQ